MMPYVFIFEDCRHARRSKNYFDFVHFLALVLELNNNEYLDTLSPLNGHLQPLSFSKKLSLLLTIKLILPNQVSTFI